jgi:hypothetical protein
MAALDTKDLVTIHLKYASAAKPLRTLAFAQLAAKALYLAGDEVDAKVLGQRISSALGVDNVSPDSVRDGLAYLKELGVASARQGNWLLTAHGKETIEDEIEASQKALDGVLARHFPRGIDRTVLRGWFNEVSAHVFGRYGDEWVGSVCVGAKPHFAKMAPLAKLFGKFTSTYKLAAHSATLNQGYIQFLASDDLADQQYLMALGQAMFSARLVAANVAADPITLEAFRGARIILDTNLLFAIALEDHRVAKAVRALGRALQRIGATPVYLRPTLDEYRRALDGVRGAALRLVDFYPKEVLEGAQNDFMTTARSRACSTVDDFERFFDSLREIPTTIDGGPTLALHEDDETEKAIKAAAADDKLRGRLQNHALQRRPEWRRKKKSAASLDHDAVLIHVSEHDRTLGEKCWILSLDRSLQSCSAERAGPHTIQPVLSVDSLVEILAANEAGPGIDPSEYAPLLANMIIYECAPPANTYTLEDLKWLRTINESVAELSPDATREIANVVARARVQGKSVTDPQLQLSVNRMYQAKRDEGEKALREAAERAKAAEAREGHEREGREFAETELIRLAAAENRRRARLTLALQLAWRIPVALAVSAGIWLLAHYAVPDRNAKNWVSYVGSIGGVVLAAWKLLPSAWKSFRGDMDSAERRARANIAERKAGKSE